MSKQLKMIKSDLKWARLALAGIDELDINVSCYHCQQAVEKLCNYSFAMKGLSHVRTHDIVILCEKMNEVNLFIPPAVERLAEKITVWESKSRYNINFLAAKQEVAEILDACDEWVNTFDRGTTTMNCF